MNDHFEPLDWSGHPHGTPAFELRTNDPSMQSVFIWRDGHYEGFEPAKGYSRAMFNRIDTLIRKAENDALKPAHALLDLMVRGY